MKTTVKTKSDWGEGGSTYSGLVRRCALYKIGVVVETFFLWLLALIKKWEENEATMQSDLTQHSALIF